MDHQSSQAAADRQGLSSGWSWLMVLAVLLLVGFIRIRLLEMPLERDEGEYAYAGQLILQGIPPYELAYNMKLPGTYLAYAVGMGVFGQTTAGVHLTLLAANSLTIILVFILGRKLFGVTAGLAACASYGVMSVSPAVLGLAAHANHFVNLFAVPATLLLWQATRSFRWTTLAFSGLLYGLAFTMKQPAVFLCLFGGLYLVWQELQNKPFSRAAAARIVVFGTAMVLPYAMICVWLGWSGVFIQFWFWTFTYAHSYVNEVSFATGMRVLGMYLGSTSDLSAGFLVLILFGLCFGWRSQAGFKPIVFTAGFLVFSFLSVAVGFHFWRNYFIMILPAFSLFIGLAMGLLKQALRKQPGPGARAFPAVLFVLVLGWNIFLQRDVFFELSGNQVCEALYPGQPFVESLAVSRYIREHSARDARIAVVGSEPQIYFYAQRHSATGYIYTYGPTEDQPHVNEMQQQMIHEIQLNQPEFIVHVNYQLSWGSQAYSHPVIFDWFDRYAGAFYERIGVVGMGRGGDVVSRWSENGDNLNLPSKQNLTVYRRKSSPP